LERWYEFQPGWYRGGMVVRSLVLGYYGLLRRILRRRPELRRCLTRCRHCRIFFLTHPRNAGRHDLGCPFGCQQAHRRRQSLQRSTAYYRDETGRMKKRVQNGKRSAPSGAAEVPPAEETSETMIKHLQMVLGRIEGRRVSRAEVEAMLLRQRSMGETAPTGDTGARSNEHPP
jgi:hypothetical protein